MSYAKGALENFPEELDSTNASFMNQYHKLCHNHNDRVFLKQKTICERNVGVTWLTKVYILHNACYYVVWVVNSQPPSRLCCLAQKPHCYPKDKQKPQLSPIHLSYLAKKTIHLSWGCSRYGSVQLLQNSVWLCPLCGRERKTMYDVQSPLEIFLSNFSTQPVVYLCGFQIQLGKCKMKIKK